MTPGIPDLIGVLAPEGRFLAIEVKTERGQLSPYQEKWLGQFKACGGVAFVARSVEDVEKGLIAHGYFPRCLAEKR